jgi:O-antigen/teichoic acid export membrane protein
MSRATDSLTSRTARAGAWRFAEALVGAISQLATAAILARLLTPADFGLVTLALVIIGFAQPLRDVGTGNALVQRSLLTDRHVRTAFTFSATISVLLAAALAAGAPWIAAVVRTPGAAPVLRVMSIVVVIRGFAIVAEALLRRDMNFRRQFFISTFSYLAGYGLVAIPLAMQGRGAWSLVWGTFAQATIASAAQLASVRHSWRPLLARHELGELLGFGTGAALSIWVNYLARNGDNVVVGRWMGAANLGLYDRAYALMNLPCAYASSVISGVLFPAMSQAQAEPVRLGRAYLIATELGALIAAPAMALLIVAAPHLVVALYGPQWTDAVLPTQILCAAGYFRALYHLGGPAAQSAGRVYSELWRQVLYAALVIGGALIALPYGLKGVSTAVGVAIVVMFVTTAQLALHVTGAGWRAYWRVQGGAIAVALVTGAVAVAVREMLEALEQSSTVITVAVLATASIPWGIGVLRALGGPRLAPLRPSLPPWCRDLAAMVRFSGGSRQAD